MRHELANIAADTQSGQALLSRYGKLAGFDRQHESFLNANTAVSLGLGYGALTFATSTSKVYDSPVVGARWEPLGVSGNVVGNMVGAQLGPTDLAWTKSEGRLLVLAGFASAPAQARHASWLEDALEELATCPEEAVDDGYDRPSELGVEKARVLIEELARHLELQPDIYPMDEGSIAVDIRHPNAKVGVLCLIEKDGSGALFSRGKKSRGRFRVDDAADLLREGGLLEMRRLGLGL